MIFQALKSAKDATQETSNDYHRGSRPSPQRITPNIAQTKTTPGKQLGNYRVLVFQGSQETRAERGRQPLPSSPAA